MAHDNLKSLNQKQITF